MRQLLDQKGRKIWSIHPDATVLDAIAKMAEKDIGSLVVMDGDELVGIITERHYAGGEAPHARHARRIAANFAKLPELVEAEAVKPATGRLAPSLAAEKVSSVAGGAQRMDQAIFPERDDFFL